MEIKKFFGASLIILGATGLTLGTLGIFEQYQIVDTNPWVFAILGLFFFISGISLVRSIGKTKTDS